MRPKPGIETIQPYQGGKPIEEVQRELGISDIIKLASNENPLGPSPLAMDAIQEAATQVNLYPDGNAYYLKQDLAAHVGISPEQLILGNGSNEVLQLVGETYVSPGDEVIYSESAFVVYMLVAKVFGAKSIITPMDGHTQDLRAMAEAITDQTRVIFIANPNNPTGNNGHENGDREIDGACAGRCPRCLRRSLLRIRRSTRLSADTALHPRGAQRHHHADVLQDLRACGDANRIRTRQARYY